MLEGICKHRGDVPKLEGGRGTGRRLPGGRNTSAVFMEF